MFLGNVVSVPRLYERYSNIQQQNRTIVQKVKEDEMGIKHFLYTSSVFQQKERM